MIRLLILIIYSFFSIINTSVAQVDEEVKKELRAEADQIAKTLNLNESKETLVYNVLYHITTRIDDLNFGTPNYNRLLDYINEERLEMMKVIMPKNTFKQYDKLYSPQENEKIKKLKEKNEEFLKEHKITQQPDTTHIIVE